MPGTGTPACPRVARGKRRTRAPWVVVLLVVPRYVVLGREHHALARPEPLARRPADGVLLTERLRQELVGDPDGIARVLLVPVEDEIHPLLVHVPKLVEVERLARLRVDQ